MSKGWNWNNKSIFFKKKSNVEGKIFHNEGNNKWERDNPIKSKIEKKLKLNF